MEGWEYLPKMGGFWPKQEGWNLYLFHTATEKKRDQRHKETK